MYHNYDLATLATRYDLDGHSLFDLIKHFGESPDYWIAGGAPRSLMLNEPITTDVDFFFRSQEAFDAFVGKFCVKEKQLASTEHHTTFNVSVGEKTIRSKPSRLVSTLASSSAWRSLTSPSVSSPFTMESCTSANTQCGTLHVNGWHFTN